MNFHLLPAFAESPVRKDGDECEKGIRRSSRMPKNLPACTKRFSKRRFREQVSEGGYASAGFAEAVKMPRAEARRASLLLLIGRGDVINFRKMTKGFVKVNTIPNDKNIIDLFPKVVSLDLHFSSCLLVEKCAYLYGVGVR